MFAIVLSIGKISVWCLLRRVNGPGRGKGVSQPGILVGAARAWPRQVPQDVLGDLTRAW